MKKYNFPYFGMTVGDVVEYCPVGNSNYNNVYAKGVILNIDDNHTGTYIITIKQISDLYYKHRNKKPSSFKHLESFIIGNTGGYFYGGSCRAFSQLKLLERDVMKKFIKKIDWKKLKKRFIFYWSITPRLHFFQDKTMIVVSVIFLKIVYLRTRK